MRLLSAIACLALATTALPAAAQPAIDVRPRQPTLGEEVKVYLYGFADGCPPDFEFVRTIPPRGLVLLQGTVPQTILPCPPGPWQDTVVLPPFTRPGPYRIEARIGEDVPPADPYPVFHAVADIEVAAPDSSLTLHEGSFVASITWHDPYGGGSGVGYAKALNSDAGWFWFFAPDNLEITLKVLDGTLVNGHWWVFLASMTDVEYTVNIWDNRGGCLSLPVDPPSCPVWTYTSRPFVNENRLDTTAFPAEP
jgi:hypothetical protein